MSATASPAGRAGLRRWAAGGALISLAAGLGALVPATQAALAASHSPTATVVAGPGAIVAGDSKKKCVDDAGASPVNRTPVVIATCDNPATDAGQNWSVMSDGTIQANGKCLDVYRDRHVNKSLVELWTCTGGKNQQWVAGPGNTLMNPVSRKCLDDPKFNVTDGTQLELFTCNGGRNQQWMLPPATP
jgi:hypothetical protein